MILLKLRDARVALSYFFAMPESLYEITGYLLLFTFVGACTLYVAVRYLVL